MRAQRIDDNVACQFRQVAVLVHQDRLVAPLKHMTDPRMLAVDQLRAYAIHLVHALREVAFGGFNDDVVVIGYLAPRVH